MKTKHLAAASPTAPDESARSAVARHGPVPLRRQVVHGGAALLGLTGLAGLVGSIVLSGCSGPRPPVVAAIVGPKETRLNGAVAASADVNPDLRRRASPVLLRLYELKAVAAFNTSDFMSLFQRDQAELGADLLLREEFILQPGESRKLDRTLNAQTQFVGVFAAFRDIDRARWRAVEPVRVGASQVWQIRVDAAGVSIQPAK